MSALNKKSKKLNIGESARDGSLYAAVINFCRFCLVQEISLFDLVCGDSLTGRIPWSL